MMGKYKRSDFINADDFIASLPADVRAAGEARAKVLIAEELTLRELRQALELTQAQVGAALGIGQEHVSRLEQRSDMLLSTLANAVKAMGGELSLVVQFPDRPPVSLTIDRLAP
jgi:DNA-binding transcriptional regulator YiaG